MAWSLHWASVSIVVVLFLLATFSSPPVLPPSVWGESTEPQNITRVRQNKAPMCARCNNLQCLPCHPKLLELPVFQPCLPPCLPVGERSLLLSSRAAAGSGVSSLPKSACVAFCSPPRSRANCAYADHLRGVFVIYAASEKCFGVCWTYPVMPGRLVTASKHVRHTRLPDT